jgi:predicted nucleic-acid-binding protein
MEALDTNILVRLATRDDAAQLRKAERLMREKFSAQSPAWISVIVVTEFAWVLARSYGYARPQIAASLRGLLNTAVFRVEDHTLVAESIDHFLSQAADFSDCVILARNESRSITPTHTLDRKAAKLDGFQLL